MTAVRPRIPDSESALSSTPANASPPPSDWQPQLITLLATLEHLRAGLDGRRLCSDTAAILDRARAMVHAAEELAGETSFASNLVAEQTEAIARAGTFLSAADSVRPVQNGGFLKSLWASMSGGSSPTSAVEVREALAAAADALNAYFALFTSRFGSSLAAREWVDAASTFLAEFRRLIRDLPA